MIHASMNAIKVANVTCGAAMINGRSLRRSKHNIPLPEVIMVSTTADVYSPQRWERQDASMIGTVRLSAQS